jgi:hypothetical protein
VDRSEFVVAEHLVAREVVGMTVFRPRFHPVAHVGHVDFEEGNRAIPGNFRVNVTHQIPKNTQRFVARFAEQDPLGVAEEFLPTRQFVVGEFAQFLPRHRLLLGGSLPRQPADARFGGEKEGVGKEFGSGEDHGSVPPGF